MYASELGMTEAVKFIILIDTSIVNMRNTEGNTALILAAKGNHHDVVHHLVAFGAASLDMANNEGRTAYTYAQCDSVRRLLRKPIEHVFAYPDTWVPCVACETGKGSEHVGWAVPDPNDMTGRRIACHVVQVPPGSEEHGRIMEMFMHGMKNTVTNVVVHRVQNPHSWFDYSLCKHKLESKGQDPNEAHHLYHTSKGDVAHVLSEGLQVWCAGDGLLGKGIYATECPLKASTYWKFSTSKRTMCVVSMALGDVYVVASGDNGRGFRKPPIGYDSVEGNFTGQKECVVYAGERVYIKYLLEFEVLPIYAETATALVKAGKAYAASVASAAKAKRGKHQLPLPAGTTHNQLPTAPSFPLFMHFKRTSKRPPPPDPIQPTCIALSSCSGRIVVGDTLGNVHLLVSWQCAASVHYRLHDVLPDHEDVVTGVSFSPDGSHVATCSLDRSLILWDLVVGSKKQLRSHSHPIRWVEFSPTGQHVATASDDLHVRVWDVRTGVSFPLQGHVDKVLCLVYIPRGDLLASSSADTNVCIWNTQSRKEDRTLRQHSHGVHLLACSADGSTLVCADINGTVTVWSVPTFELKKIITMGCNPPSHILVHPLHPTLLFVSDRKGTVRTVALPTGEQKKMYAIEGEVPSMAVSADGTTLMCAVGSCLAGVDVQVDVSKVVVDVSGTCARRVSSPSNTALCIPRG
jgi:WD40 repeat protein